MKIPIDITFHGVPHSDWIEGLVRKEAVRLDLFYDRIMKCQVVIDKPHHHHRKGNLYNIRIAVTVPGEEIVVNREPNLRGAKRNMEVEDWTKSAESGASRRRIDVAVREAFGAACRLLQDYARRHRGQLKSHTGEPHGRVSQLFSEDYGLLATADGRDIYFHKNSVLNGKFDDLKVGAEVSFVEEAGDKGPQASTVKPLGKARRA